MSHTEDCGCQEYNELSRRQFVAGAGAAFAAAANAAPAAPTNWRRESSLYS